MKSSSIGVQNIRFAKEKSIKKKLLSHLIWKKKFFSLNENLIQRSNSNSFWNMRLKKKFPLPVSPLYQIFVRVVPQIIVVSSYNLKISPFFRVIITYHIFVMYIRVTQIFRFRKFKNLPELSFQISRTHKTIIKIKLLC